MAKEDKNLVAARQGRRSGVLTMAVLVTVIGGCSTGDMSDLRQQIAAIKAKPPGRIDPVPQINPVPPYPYVVSAKRDPFAYTVPAQVTAPKPEVTEAVESGPTPPVHNPEPLEAFPLDTLKYVGLLEKGGEVWAIITAPDQLVYRVKHQNFLGQNYGQIVGISETELDIVEIVPTGQPNRWVERRATLALE